MGADNHILTINSGSSSVKFALFNMDGTETRLFYGDLEGIEAGDSRFRVYDENKKSLADRRVSLPDHRAALKELFAWLTQAHPHRRVDAVGHRIVHGGAEFIQPHMITPDLLSRLKSLIPLAPDHLPHEIKAIEAVNHGLPTVPQAACFDTAFHRSLPQKARMFALPRNLEQEGVRRYGFHGLSCEYVLQELEKEAGAQAAKRRVIIAHLGGGASLTAVQNGQSVDTTMGLTPLGGLVMGTRCGDIDPGVLLFLLQEKGFTPQKLSDLLNHHSGLLGVSGLSPDMETLLEQSAEDPHADQAVELFVYQARKHLAAMAAVLNGPDTLVFTGGIGENAPVIRQRICQGMEFSGIRLDVERNKAGKSVISEKDSPVVVRVIKTNEELMIARHAAALIE